MGTSSKIRKIGIICQDDVNIVGHLLFNNYRKALQNYFKGSTFKDIERTEQLDGLDYVFIVDEHFIPHTEVWKKDSFIQKVNDLNIKVLVFNFEKIYSSQFPWNADHQNKLETFNNLIQLFSDIEDRKLKNGILNKQLLSKDTKLINNNKEKIEKAVFIGQANGSQYYRRQETLQQLKSDPAFRDRLDIIVTDRKYTYQEYLDILSKYKYVINPLGTGDFLNLRFYEALELGCIPIQQVTPSMLPHYKELEFGLLLHDLSNAADKKFKKMNYYLEDFFEEIGLSNIVD